MQFQSLIHLLFRNILNNRSTTLWLPRIFFHQKYVNESIKARTCLNRILNLNTLWTIDFLHRSDDIIEITLIRIQLIDQEDNRLTQLLCIAEVVLSTYFRTILTINKDNSLIGYIHRSNRTAHKVITTRTINDIKLLVVPLNMKNCREHRIAIFQFNWEVVAHRILRFYRASTLDNACFKQHTLGKCSLAATRTAQQRNVFNLISLINSHDAYRF